MVGSSRDNKNFVGLDGREAGHPAFKLGDEDAETRTDRLCLIEMLHMLIDGGNLGRELIPARGPSIRVPPRLPSTVVAVADDSKITEARRAPLDVTVSLRASLDEFLALSSEVTWLITVETIDFSLLNSARFPVAAASSTTASPSVTSALIFITSCSKPGRGACC